MEELMARMRSLLRRQSAVKEAVLEHRGIKLDLVGRTVHLAGEPVDLTSREFALLEIFMQNVGRILSRKLICEKCWSSHYDHEANLLDVYMSRLRAKFEAIRDRRVQDRARRRLSTAVKSIGARLALWYAGAATLTMVALFVVGYYLLENQLIRGSICSTRRSSHRYARIWAKTSPP